MKCALYRVSHKDTGHDYVGISVRPVKRWQRHRTNANCGSKLYFHSALRKYGHDAFDWKIIAWASSTEGACHLERMAIHLGMGHYNLTTGGEGGCGAVRSPETRMRMSLAKRGIKKTPEHVAKMREFRHTDEAKAKMSATRRGKPQSPELILKRSMAMKGHVVSAETRAKISAAHKKRIKK